MIHPRYTTQKACERASTFHKLIKQAIPAVFGVVSLLLIVFLALAPVPAAPKTTNNASNSERLGELSPEAAQQKALMFLPRKDIVLVQRGFESWGVDRGKGLKCYHFEGPKDEYLAIDVDTTSGTIRRYDWSRLQSESQTVVLTLQQAQEKAEQFLKDRTKVFDQGNLVLRRGELLNHGGGGKEYTFEWHEVVANIEYPYSVAIRITAQTGEVVGFQLYERTLKLASLTPKISKEKAIALAGPKIDLELGYKSQAVLFISSDPTRQKLMWRVIAKGMKMLPFDPLRGQIAYDAFTEVQIDALSGELGHAQTMFETPHRIVQVKAPNYPKTLISDDKWPVLTNQETRPLLFITSRGRDYNLTDADFINGKANAYVNLIASGVGGRIDNLFASPGSVRHISWNAPRKRIAFEMYETIYILDIASGALGQCNDRERVRRKTPSWDSSGVFLAMSGTHSPADRTSKDDDDIFIVKTTQTLSRVSIESNRCIAHLPGVDTLPVFSPDNQWIVFAHQEAISNSTGVATGQNWAIYRVRTDKSYSQAGYEKPEKITGNLPEPERISWFPDGKQILVSYARNEYEMKNPPNIVNVENKSVQLLKLPVLNDPDFPTTRSLIMLEPQVSPDGKQIAFCALRWSGDAKDEGAICIYTCNLDGSNLKRITPAQGVPLKPYQYPQPGITALNAWQKLEPKPNLGKPWSLEIQMQERQRELEEREKKREKKNMPTPTLH
jgi:Tol biopolymer transport system component